MSAPAEATSSPFATQIAAAAGSVAGLVILADAWIWGVAPGLAIPIYAGVVFAVAVFLNRRQVSKTALSVLAVCAIPAAEAVSPLALAYLVIGLTVAVQIQCHPDRRKAWTTCLVVAARSLVSGPTGLLRDLRVLTASPLTQNISLAGVLGWAVPIGIGLAFMALFAVANPLLDTMLRTGAQALIPVPDSGLQLLFWSVLALGLWPMIRAEAGPHAQPSVPHRWLNRPAFLTEPTMLRILICANAAFACETLLDLTYLWAGNPLPEGMSYAAYSHRGAYPLFGAACLALLITLLTNAGQQRSPVLRQLALLWMGQTALLLLSALARLDLYVSHYALTTLRFWAGVGMCATGLMLAVITMGLFYRVSNAVILRRGTAVGLVFLWGLALVDSPAYIAGYNVRHASEVTGQGLELDVRYLCGQGRNASRAILWFEAQPGGRALPCGPGTRTDGRWRVADPPITHDWRSWGFRDWRLTRYLATQTDALRPPAAPTLNGQRP